jgi:Na+/H+ antiporter NhaC
MEDAFFNHKHKSTSAQGSFTPPLSMLIIFISIIFVVTKIESSVVLNSIVVIASLTLMLINNLNWLQDVQA